DVQRVLQPEPLEHGQLERLRRWLPGNGRGAQAEARGPPGWAGPEAHAHLLGVDHVRGKDTIGSRAPGAPPLARRPDLAARCAGDGSPLRRRVRLGPLRGVSMVSDLKQRIDNLRGYL